MSSIASLLNLWDFQTKELKFKYQLVLDLSKDIKEIYFQDLSMFSKLALFSSPSSGFNLKIEIFQNNKKIELEDSIYTTKSDIPIDIEISLSYKDDKDYFHFQLLSEFIFNASIVPDKDVWRVSTLRSFKQYPISTSFEEMFMNMAIDHGKANCINNKEVYTLLYDYIQEIVFNHIVIRHYLNKGWLLN